MKLLTKLLMKGGAVAPSTLQYAYASVSGGLAGQVDASTGGRLYTTAWIGGGDAGVITLWIKGTSASAWAYHWSGNYTNVAGLLEVSVDDGAYSAPTPVSAKFPLFTGLSDTLHKVVLRCAAAYSGMYVVTSGNVVEVTGAPPAISTAASMVQYGTANTYWSSPTASKGGAWTPAPTNTGFSTGSTSITYAVKFKSSSAYLDIVSRGAYVGVSIDGATPTYYAMPTSKLLRVSTSGTHDYYVFAIGAAPNGTADMFAIGLDSSTLATTAAKRMHQYGDSITYGSSSTSVVHTDVQRVAAALGYVGQNIGISGQTSTTLATNVVTQAAQANGNVANDIAVLAIGKNNPGNFISADFDSITTTLLTYYKKVLVRGVLETGEDFTAYNSSMSSWVTGKGNPNIVYINSESWTGIATADGVHPTDAGYATIAGYAITAYTPHV
jgi:lysophospholipase L1-like esterase